MNTRKKRYGLGHFLLDFFLVVITGGLWGLFLLFRALNRH